ncbi:hypothetical protein L6164_027911 [Bauhinia variegata]|uniref:Uncharacterized protein n=1 Tax=Bauhinia variegata TaxID=167791 RepID=A0ACB9LW07_BAUVA|nr:hypothetical protein L6164_027911 [Bauhinia variegata]
MEKRLRSSLQSSAKEFISLATKQNLKSSKSSLRTLIHSIKPSSELSSSLPIALCNSISNSVQSFHNLAENGTTSLSPSKSPPTKRVRQSSRHSKAPAEAEPETHDSNVDDQKQKVVERLEVLAQIALLCVSHPQNAFSPTDLLPGVQVLHDNLIKFDEDSDLSSAIGFLCEQCWKDNFPGRELLISQFIPFLLSRSLTLKKKVDVHRVCMLREAFAMFDFEDESIVDLKFLLLRCIISPLYFKTEDGRRFLSFVFGLNDNLIRELLAMIRAQIPFGRKSTLEAYSDILFRSWKAAERGSRDVIENRFLQNLIEGAIHASSSTFASYIRKVLGGFISQRAFDGVEKMLFRLAEPLLFRSLQVANSNVRQNALHLLLDMFPLEDPGAPKMERDALLDEQFLLLERLLTDNCPEVRTIAVEGCCRILRLFWQIISAHAKARVIKKIFDEVSHDVCSEVRLCVLNGIIYLIGNSESHRILKLLLPKLQHLMLDNALTVRVAAADLLLQLKDMKDFQFNKVVELDILLSVLANDLPPVAQKITEVLLPSYFPSKVSIEEACSRCVTLIRRSPTAGARFVKFACLEGASKRHLMELVKVFMSLLMSPDKLDANQIEGFFVAVNNICDNLVSKLGYRNTLKELIAGEKVKRLLDVASTGKAQSSLFNIVSTVCPDYVAGLLEKCMDTVTNCSGLAEDADRQAAVRSAHKLLLSSGAFDDMFEVLTTFLQKAAYRCHIKFGVDIPQHSVTSSKRKKSDSSGKSLAKFKIINRRQSFEDDYSVAVGIAWQVRDFLLHEDTQKALLRSPTLETSFFALKVISEASIVYCGQYEYIDPFPVLAYMALVQHMTLHNVCTSSIQNHEKKKRNNIDSSTSLSETVLELTIHHVLNCLEKLFGADDTPERNTLDSDNLRSTNRRAQSSAHKRREFPTGASSRTNNVSMHNEPQSVSSKVKMLTAVLMFMVDTTAMSFVSHNHVLLLNYASRGIEHIIHLFDQLHDNQIQFKDVDVRDTVFCLKSSFTYAAKLITLVIRDSGESFSTIQTESFHLASELFDLIVSIESNLGSGDASRLVAAAKPWLPDFALALGFGNFLQHPTGDAHSKIYDQIKLRLPKWLLIVAKAELSGLNEDRSEENDKFSAFNRLMSMLLMLLKGKPQIMDAIGIIFLTCSMVELERKEFGLALGLLHFVCCNLFKRDDKEWGDLMLASLQEIYPKIEREIEEQSHEDEQEKLQSAKELLEPLWMYHLYETGKVFMTDA